MYIIILFIIRGIYLTVNEIRPKNAFSAITKTKVKPKKYK